MFSPNPETFEQQPFGNELAKVSELVEEFSSPISPTPLTPVDEEEIELASKGLFKFAADDYMSELQGLYITAFGDMPPMSTVWI
jgi:hypothetical protein